MRTCPCCDGPIRYDEALSSLETPDGVTPACPACHARQQGHEPPPAQTYPVGSRIPRHPQGDGDLPICGLCRRALYEGDRAVPIRLAEEEIDEPGVYRVCRECFAEYQPMICARLKRTGRVGEHVPDRAIRGNMLL